MLHLLSEGGKVGTPGLGQTTAPCPQSPQASRPHVLKGLVIQLYQTRWWDAEGAEPRCPWSRVALGSRHS